MVDDISQRDLGVVGRLATIVHNAILR